MQQLPKLQALVINAGLGEFWAQLAPHYRPSIRVLPQAGPLTAPLALGGSRLGGAPDMPAAVA